MAKDFLQIGWDAATEAECRRIVAAAIAEDLGPAPSTGDITTLALVPTDATAAAALASRSAGTISGINAAKLALEIVDPRVVWRAEAGLADGAKLDARGTIATITGPARSMLSGERIALNLLGRLSGIATLTARYVAAVEGTKARIYDIRKTTPGWRRLEKYAVRCGGGFNHRLSLMDAILIKDNHLAFGAESPGSGRFSPPEAVQRARQFLRSRSPTASDTIIEIEVDSLAQLRDVLPAQPDIVLLDNMSLDQLREAIAIRGELAPEVELEASGGVRLDTVGKIAQTGVERISVGALTHSAPWLDIGLDWL